MNPQRWHEIEDLYHAALGREPVCQLWTPPASVVGRPREGVETGVAARTDRWYRKNSGTAISRIASLLGVSHQERLAQLSAAIDRFAESGPKSCTTHPHSFF